jgi:hypothetical protein
MEQGRRLIELTNVAQLFPGDLLLVDNQGTSRKVTLQQLIERVIGTNAPGIRRAAKITFDSNGFVAGIANGLLTGSASLTFAAIAAASEEVQTISVPGAEVGDCVSIGLPTTLPAGLAATAWVSSANTVSVRLHNYTTVATLTPPTATYNVAVHKL